MRHGSLFSGIGGFDLASEWMGWENVFHCDNSPFCNKILKHYWPKAISYEDITNTDFSIHRGAIDIISGGFPCQPFSVSGKRAGTEDSRYLWPEMLRVIREIRPTWIVGENVYGLVNWNEGLVFDTVCTDLENEGFEVVPIVLPACAVDAPHQRFRIFFIAHSNDTRDDDHMRHNGEWKKENKVWRQEGILAESWKDGGDGFASDTFSEGLQGRADTREVSDKKRKMGGKKRESANVAASVRVEQPSTRNQGEGAFGTRTHWKEFPTVAPVCYGDDGLSSQLDGITFSKWRQESIKAGGNAVVVPLVHQLFKTIEEYNLQFK